MNTSIVLRSRAFRALVLAGFFVVAAAPAFAATITIVNGNAAGVGFNDPAPRTPIGGNTGTTLGQQRLNIFNYAAAIWGSMLPSNVTIVVNAQFSALTCTPTSAVLGSCGSNGIIRDFPGAPFAGTWYNMAPANKLAGSDLNGAAAEMNANFNLSIDANCFTGFSWYYGIDGNEPANGIELLPVLLHEMGHGLGFQTQTSGTSGAYTSGFPTVFDRFLLNKTTGLHWSEGGDTTAARNARKASAIALDQLVWDGPNAVLQATTFLNVGQPQVFVNSPAGIAGMKTAQDATFGAALTTTGLTGNVVQALDPNDVNGTSTLDACSPLTNAAAVAGKIALVDRGTCTFVTKALNVQAAGATGMIVVNNAATGLPGMGGTDPTITIPCVGISQADGNAIKANLAGGVNGTIGRSATVKAGADASFRAKMYTPNPFVSGSSVSHWDTSLTPNALMEPNINNDLHMSLDLTLGEMRDIGWFRTNKPASSK